MTITETHSLAVGDRTVAYTLRRSRRARYARIEVGSSGGLTVVVPAFYDGDRVRLLLLKKHRWITAKLDKYGDLESAERRKPVKAGDTIPYLGNNMLIETEMSEANGGNVSVAGQTLVVSLSPGQEDVRTALEKWYRTQARERIGSILDRFCARMGVSHNRVTLKGHRSLWGSCSRKRNLNFNWRLVMTPLPIIEYVVIHELAHLKEMNHSPRFWRIVESHCPEWRESRRWLNEQSQRLGRTLATE